MAQQQKTIPQIRSDIERSKEDMARTAHEIEHRVDELKHWRTAVKRYPLTSLGASVLLGALLSGSMPGIIRSVIAESGPLLKSGLTALIVDSIRGD